MSMNNNTQHTDSPQWDVVYQYTRPQAIADGFQIEVTKTAQEAGIRFPVFITHGVYEQCVAVPPGVTGQDESGRLWDIMPSTRLCRAVGAFPAKAEQVVTFCVLLLGIIHAAPR